MNITLADFTFSIRSFLVPILGLINLGAEIGSFRACCKRNLRPSDQQRTMIADLDTELLHTDICNVNGNEIENDRDAWRVMMCTPDSASA